MVGRMHFCSTLCTVCVTSQLLSTSLLLLVLGKLSLWLNRKRLRSWWILKHALQMNLAVMYRLWNHIKRMSFQRLQSEVLENKHCDLIGTISDFVLLCCRFFFDLRLDGFTLWIISPLLCLHRKRILCPEDWLLSSSILFDPLGWRSGLFVQSHCYDAPEDNDHSQMGRSAHFRLSDCCLDPCQQK